MNDDLVSKSIDAYENEPGVMQFPAMYAAGKVFEAFYKAEIDRIRAENKALRDGIEKALDEIEDDGPKALKYAAQELRAAMKEQAE